MLDLPNPWAGRVSEGVSAWWWSALWISHGAMNHGEMWLAIGQQNGVLKNAKDWHYNGNNRSKTKTKIINQKSSWLWTQKFSWLISEILLTIKGFTNYC